jgi:hypothetical protein
LISVQTSQQISLARAFDLADQYPTLFCVAGRASYYKTNPTHRCDRIIWNKDAEFDMPEPKLEQVFKTSGIPTYTFVKPTEFGRMLIGLRTPGRGLIVEGPSGIGKTTGVLKSLEDIGLSEATLKLSARKVEDVAVIEALPSMGKIGTVLIDDFHWLEPGTKQIVADYMKTLADEETAESKLILVGINKAGDSLVKFAVDLNNRIDTISLETNSEDRVRELIRKGEEALNIRINSIDNIIADSHGSFHIAQMLCREVCITAEVYERAEELATVDVSLEVVRERVLEELARAFFTLAKTFATGPRLRREGRAPYLHVLKWLADHDEWSIQLEHALSVHPDQRGSVGQIIEKGYLHDFMKATKQLADVIHFDSVTQTLSIEDPKFIYYLRNLIWNKFARQVGYLSATFKGRYDFALSFAGADRDVASMFNQILGDQEVGVFYDMNEQHRILASNVEDYLAPIYRSEAEFVVVLLGKEYPNRIWTKFESEQFKKRFGEERVIPIWFSDAPPGMFDLTTQVGGITIDRAKDIPTQVRKICRVLVRKLADLRVEPEDDDA